MRFRNYFLCRPRATRPHDDDPLLALLKGWDLSQVEIGMICFLAEPEPMPGKVRVGALEADPLNILDGTREILCEQLHVPGFVLHNVAKNSEHFLDALLPAAELFARRLTQDIAFDDLAATRQTADRCVALAGGERYLSFYHSVLGVR